MPRIIYGLFCAACPLAGSTPVEAISRPPNILFFIADDWGTHAGAYGTTWVKTPAFDRLAREGILFSHAYTPVAKCAPSRAIILTGRHAWQNGAAANHNAIFPPELKSWPEVLGERGWHMGITGKGWGPGIALDAAGKPRQLAGRPYDRRKATPPTTGISPTDYAANFADFLDATPPAAPWCFWAGPVEPHRDYEYRSGANKGGKRPSDIDRVPAYWPDNEVVRHDMLDYAFEIENLDQQLGRMLDELDRRGLRDSTLIVGTSDHGMPFPRVKGYATEQANHVPLAVRWPQGVRGSGRTIDDFVDFTDLAATFLDYAHIDAAGSGMQPVTGRSWRPLFESAKSGRVEPARDHVLLGKERNDVGRPHDWGYPIRGIIADGFLYLKNFEPARWPAGNPESGYPDTDASPTKTLILERGRAERSDFYWQQCFGLRPGEELFDLGADPDCVRNLAGVAAQESRLDGLRWRLEATLRAQGDPRLTGMGHLFDEFPPAKNRAFYERRVRGEPVDAGWLSPADFEPAPLEAPAP
jgi:arylsulfatase A-like enzyme